MEDPTLRSSSLAKPITPYHYATKLCARGLIEYRAVLAAAIIAASPSQAQINPGEIVWTESPPALPKGAKLAVLSGDPGKKGIFTIRLRLPPNYLIAPHRHPSDELITVIDGQLSVGMGTVVDRIDPRNLVCGGYAVAAANMNHFLLTTDGATVQITAEGPFQMVYADPKDDPRLQ